jgi:hypothetical protein
MNKRRLAIIAITTVLILLLLVFLPVRELYQHYKVAEAWKSATPEQRHKIYANNDKYIIEYLIGKSHSVVNDFLGPPDRDKYNSTWTYDLGYCGIGFVANNQPITHPRYYIIIQYNDKGLVEIVDGPHLRDVLK